MDGRIAERQVTIPKREWRRLEDLSIKEGVPVADLLLGAVQQYLAKKEKAVKAAGALQQSFGIWKDRDDLPEDSTDVVDELRGEWDDRLARLGIS